VNPAGPSGLNLFPELTALLRRTGEADMPRLFARTRLAVRSTATSASSKALRERGTLGVFAHTRAKLTVAAAALLMVASCAGAAGAQQECSWGASSITASYENGRTIVSKPQTSGCTPSVEVASSAASVR